MVAELPSDGDLLQQIQDGNASAFAILVRRHQEKYYRLAYRYLANRESAEDMIQTAFLKLWENPNIWNPNKDVKFTTWFYRVVVNACLDKKKKHRTLALPESFEIKDDRPNQEMQSIHNEAQALVQTHLTALPDRQKTALILCFYEELSHIDAAQIMKISVKALQSLLMRAKITLRQDMKLYY